MGLYAKVYKSDISGNVVLLKIVDPKGTSLTGTA